MANETKDKHIEAVVKEWSGVVLLITPGTGGLAFRRAAAFVFGLPGGGFAWVEPSYLDPLGASSPAFHARPRADVVFMREDMPDLGFTYTDPETGEAGMVYPWRASDWPGVPDLDDYTRTLAARGTTVADERERLMPGLVRSVAA